MKFHMFHVMILLRKRFISADGIEDINDYAIYFIEAFTYGTNIILLLTTSKLYFPEKKTKIQIVFLNMCVNKRRYFKNLLQIQLEKQSRKSSVKAIEGNLTLYVYTDR